MCKGKVSSEINVKFLLYKRERERERERIRIHVEICLRNGWLGGFAKHGGIFAYFENWCKGGKGLFLSSKFFKSNKTTGSYGVSP